MPEKGPSRHSFYKFHFTCIVFVCGVFYIAARIFASPTISSEHVQKFMSRCKIQAWVRSFPILLLVALGACQTVPPLPKINFSEPGWTIRQGQAIWRSQRDAPEMAGELLVATNSDGRAFVQFTKTPLPFAVAQIAPNAWQIESPVENKRYTGRGKPSAKIIWLQLPRCLSGAVPAKPWSWQTLDNGRWRLENR